MLCTFCAEHFSVPTVKRSATTETKQLFSLNTQQAAGDIRNNAENITNKPVSWVINSHLHSDHT